jgi:3-dehydroquinate dehydratase
MICIPIKPVSASDLFNKLKEAQALKPDLIEIWFEELKIENLDLQQLNAIIETDILYKSFGSLPHLKHLVDNLQKIKYLDFDYEVELDFETDKEKIISYHNFDKTPDTAELKEIIAKMSEKGADIYKLAVMANSYDDSLRVMSLLSQCHQEGKKMVMLAMGESGKITRIAGHLLGNQFMFASLNEESKTANGQLTFKELHRLQNLI